MPFASWAGKTGAMTTELDLAWFDPSLGGIQRRPASGVTTGLSHAIAERIGVDVVLVRVVFVVLALCSGLGIALYGWGTALTRGPQGTRPIDRVLPGFRTWPAALQKIAVVVATATLMAMVGSAFPLPWGPGVLVLIVLAFMRRRALRTTSAVPHQQPVHHPGYPAPAPGPLDDQSLIDLWRRSVTNAVGTQRAVVPARQLPEVDLYAEDEEPLDRESAPEPKVSWWAGLGVLAAMLATAGVTGGLMGFSGMIALASATAVGGLGAVVFALTARNRRLPRFVLALVAVPVVATGWLAAQTSSASAPLQPDTYEVQVIAEDAVVDLRTHDLSGYDTVRVEAIASNVEVILPGPVQSISAVQSWAADVTDLTGNAPSGGDFLELDLEISARLSTVTIKDAP